MKQNERDEQKDGLLFQRASKSLNPKFVEDDDIYHLCINKKILCGTNVRAKIVSLTELPCCPACNSVYAEILAVKMAEENRNYWLNPQHGGGGLPDELRKKKPVKVKYEKVPLPDELLPTGSGMPVRHIESCRKSE